MPYVKCKTCNKEFYIKPSHQKLGFGKYCSKKCQAEGQKKGRFVICEICGKEIWRMPKELKKSKSEKFFCSKRCQTIWRNKTFVKDLHGNWNGGKTVYRKIMKNGKMKPICKKCGINDERVLVVHHKDKNRKNNNIKNLIWLCRNCHCLIHNHNVKI